MTPAAQHIIAKASGRMGGKRRARRAKKAKVTRTRKKSRRTGKRGNRLVKGSAAAKAWGRKMKAARKRR